MNIGKKKERERKGGVYVIFPLLFSIHTKVKISLELNTLFWRKKWKKNKIKNE